MAIHSRLQRIKWRLDNRPPQAIAEGDVLPSGFGRLAVNMAVERLLHFSGRSFDKITGHEATFTGSYEGERFVPNFIVATKRLQPYCRALKQDRALLKRLQLSGAAFVTLSKPIVDSYQKPYARQRPGLIFDLDMHHEIRAAANMKNFRRASPVIDLIGEGRIALPDILALAAAVETEFGRALDRHHELHAAYKSRLSEHKSGLGSQPRQTAPGYNQIQP